VFDFCNQTLICSITLLQFCCFLPAWVSVFEHFKTPADLTSNDLWLLLRHLSKPTTNEFRQSVGFWCSLRSDMFYNHVFCCEQSTTDNSLSFQSAEIVSSSLICHQRCLWTLYIVSLPFSASPPIKATWVRGAAFPSKNGRGTPFPRVPPLNLTTECNVVN